ncbi:MAG TPA: DUF6064 family protein [Caldimonas sp.]|nr:DUF6064 family protein [Caldimonas sp.]HEX2541720.1 DUF6064 family protein [Caldimonas sp.]
MSEWWTYRPSDFLLFSSRTYLRLFELHNTALWPAQLVAAVLCAVLLWLAWRGGRSTARAACAIVGVGWLFTATAYFVWRYATINWAAAWFGAAFLLEGALLVALAASRACPALSMHASGHTAEPRRVVGAVLLVAGIAYPLLAPVLGRPWIQAEVFGLAPDPTAIGTLGLLLLLEWGEERRLRRIARMAWTGALWAIPVAWCVLTGITLWTLRAPEAIIAPALAVLACAASRAGRRSPDFPRAHAADP